MGDDSRNIVIAVFPEINAAQMTADELQMAGFDDDEIQLVDNGDSPAHRRAGATVQDDDDGGAFLDRLISGSREDDLPGEGARHFRVLEGPSDVGVESYLKALYRAGRHVLVVSSQDELSEAVAIMRRNGAEIANRAALWLGRQRVASRRSGLSLPVDRRPGSLGRRRAGMPAGLETPS